MPVKITQVTETSDVGDNGRLIPSVRITFTVGQNGPFTVTLAKQGFTAQTANEKIREFVSHLTGLQGIS